MLKLAWDYTGAFDSFEVYRPSSSAGPEVIFASTNVVPTDANPFLLDTAAMPLGTYQLAVRAVRGGQKSAPSNQVGVTVVINAPANLRLVP